MQDPPEPVELPPEHQAELDEAVRLLLGIDAPPSHGPDDGEPVAA